MFVDLLVLVVPAGVNMSSVPQDTAAPASTETRRYRVLQALMYKQRQISLKYQRVHKFLSSVPSQLTSRTVRVLQEKHLDTKLGSAQMSSRGDRRWALMQMCSLTVAPPRARDTSPGRDTHVSTVFVSLPHADSARGRDAVCSLQAEGAGFLHGDQQLLMQHGVGGVRGQVQAVEAGMSPGRETQAG